VTHGLAQLGQAVAGDLQVASVQGGGVHALTAVQPAYAVRHDDYRRAVELAAAAPRD